MRMFTFGFLPFIWLGLFIKVLFWVLFAFVIVKLVSLLFSDKHNGDDQEEISEKNEIADNALDILKKRYAKGEISSKEFTRMKKEIE